MQNQQLTVINKTVQTDAWISLRIYTAARIALGRTGISIPLKASLNFKMAHANARDAIYAALEKDKLVDALKIFPLHVYVLQTIAQNRYTYLQRPDYGRRLNEKSAQELRDFKSDDYDVSITIADGLSSTAVNRHAANVLLFLMPMLQTKYSISPFCIVEQGRVAVSDETGYLLKAKLSLILIGERPGLTAFDSLGAYITFKPTIGLTDEKRNCISNIRTDGLSYQNAANKIFYIVSEALRLQISGIDLKDNMSLIKIESTNK